MRQAPLTYNPGVFLIAFLVALALGIIGMGIYKKKPAFIIIGAVLLLAEIGIFLI